MTRAEIHSSANYLEALRDSKWECPWGRMG